MKIELKKFGNILISRQSGREAYNAFKPTMQNIGESEEVVLDFVGVDVLSPSWADEFITILVKDFSNNIIVKKTDNLSVIETLDLLQKINNYILEIK